MKITKINIEFKTKYFLKYKGLNDKNDKIQLQKDLKSFIDNTKDIEIIESGEIRDVGSSGVKYVNDPNNYSGYFVKYYDGIMLIDGKSVSMRVSLNKKVMNLVFKEAGGEIKELVKKEYEEFTNELYQLIERTEKKNIFGNFVVSKFKKLKEAILNSNN